MERPSSKRARYSLTPRWLEITGTVRGDFVRSSGSNALSPSYGRAWERAGSVHLGYSSREAYGNTRAGRPIAPKLFLPQNEDARFAEGPRTRVGPPGIKNQNGRVQGTDAAAVGIRHLWRGAAEAESNPFVPVPRSRHSEARWPMRPASVMQHASQCNQHQLPRNSREALDNSRQLPSAPRSPVANRYGAFPLER